MVLQGFDPMVHTINKFISSVKDLNLLRDLTPVISTTKILPRRQILKWTQVAILWGH